MPRRRRRRPDSLESLDNLDGLDDEQDDLEIRLGALEEELRNIQLSARTQAADTLAMRARLEELAREFEEGGGEDEAFEELDTLERKVGTIRDQLLDRMNQLTSRLEQVGGNGRLEDLPGVLEDRIRGWFDDRLRLLGASLDARLATLESSRGDGETLSAAQLEDFSKRTEGMFKALRDEFGELVGRVRDSFAQELQETVDTVEARLAEKISPVILEAKLEALSDDFQEKLSVDLNAIRMHLEGSIRSLQERVSALGDPARMQDLLSSRASQGELDALKQDLEDLKGSVTDAGSLGEKARKALERVETLETQVREQENLFKELSERAEEYSGIAEEHLDRVNLAVRLVDTLEEKLETAIGSADSLVDELNVSEEVPDLGFELDDLLQVMIKHQATDLHLKVGAPPYVRLDGELIPVGNHVLGPDGCKRLVYSAIPMGKRRQLLRDKDVNFRYETPGAKFEATAFLERGYVSAVFRMMPAEVPSLEDLYLPTVLKKLATMNSGLVFIAGPGNSGKSTTLASVVDYVNAKRKVHIVTIEDPIEFYHQDRTSIVTQREIGPDVGSFAAALRRATRQDPDVLVLSDLPDADSMWGAITAADQGSLVFAAVPAENCVGALDRVLGFFPEDEQWPVRKRLSGCLRGVISQFLLNRLDQKGRVPATEVMLVNPAIGSVIAEGALARLLELIQQGESEGMMTFHHSLTRLFDAGLISQDEALGHEAPPPAVSSPTPPVPVPRQAAPPPAPGPPGSPPPASPHRTGMPPLAAPVARSGEPPPEPMQEDTLMNWL
ncbi:MAG: PilT/PilU family type 4a pilus ATPase [Armatimonadetes bacterium]|nr:PilT/PilU family type 4a pilus ATPase [Armatimonadota bacterium]